MINCNPETVSTDYDTSDRLYFEPLTAEDVLEIITVEQSKAGLKGVIVQFGGQTPLKLAHALEAAGVPILGTSPDAIDLAEDRDRFKALVDRLGLKQPQSGIARNLAEARSVCRQARLPRDGSPFVCAGRPGHGDRRRRREIDRYVSALAVTLDQPSEFAVSDSGPLLDRPLSRRCHRGRRRLPMRRQGHLHRRHPGAHRGSRQSTPATAPARCPPTRSPPRSSCA
jgi:carbamoyl-phosphate synthase large subunit